MGLFSSLIGILIGAYIAITAIGDGYEWFPLYAGFAAFLTSCLLWRIFIERKKSYRIVVGIFVGALSGFLSHYVCWYLQIAIANFRYLVFGTGLSSLGEPPMNLLLGISGALGLSYWSWIFFGWLTVAAGGIIGGGFCWYLSKEI